MKDNVPTFELNIADIENIKEAKDFHYRILEFVKLNINGQISSEILCYMRDLDSEDILEFKLPKKAYKQALQASLDFFTEIEDYEQCSTFKELITQI